jgi:hypothetical protein
MEKAGLWSYASQVKNGIAMCNGVFVRRVPDKGERLVAWSGKLVYLRYRKSGGSRRRCCTFSTRLTKAKAVDEWLQGSEMGPPVLIDGDGISKWSNDVQPALTKESLPKHGNVGSDTQSWSMGDEIFGTRPQASK